MVQTSFFEKLKVFFEVSKTSGINIATILILVFMAFLFLTTNKKNAKASKKLYGMIYLILLAVILLIYNASLPKMFDYMMNNFFIGFYFPNLAIYLAAIVFTNVILLKTIFNFRKDKLLKYINTIVYCIIHYILVLILNLITTNKLDVFDQASVYKNNNISALIGLSSTIFIVWIIFMIVYNFIRKTQRKPRRIKVPVRRVIRYKKMFPANYQSISIPSMLYGEVGKIKVESIPVPIPDVVPEQLSLLDMYKQEQSELEDYEKKFTLDDYKKMSEILKSDYNKEPILIPIDKAEEEEESFEDEEDTLVDQIVEKVEEKEVIEQPKLEELLNLYRSV